MRFCRVFFASRRERSFSRKLGTGEQSRDSRNANHENTPARFFSASETNEAPVARRRRLTRASLLRPSATTDFCSGSSPRTATRSWAAASPALSASSPTTTCPRARRASASAARSEVRAAPPRAIRLPSPDASRARPRGYPGRPGDARARPGPSRTIPRAVPARPRVPPGAPGCPRYPRARRPDERRRSCRPALTRTTRVLSVLLRASRNPQPTGRAGSPPSRSMRTARQSPPTSTEHSPPRARRTAAARPSPRGASARARARILRRARALPSAREPTRTAPPRRIIGIPIPEMFCRLRTCSAASTSPRPPVWGHPSPAWVPAWSHPRTTPTPGSRSSPAAEGPARPPRGRPTEASSRSRMSSRRPGTWRPPGASRADSRSASARTRSRCRTPWTT